MIQLILLSVLTTVISAAHLSSCGSNNDVMTNVDIALNPDPPKPGKDLTFTMTGTLTKALTTSVLNAAITVDVAGQKLPVNGGASIKGIQAIPQGDVKISFGPFTWPRLPLGIKPVLDGNLTLADENGKQVVCIKMDELPLYSTEEMQLAMPQDNPPVSNCGNPSDHLEYVQISEVNGVIYANGTLDEDIGGGTLDIDVLISLTLDAATRLYKQMTQKVYRRLAEVFGPLIKIKINMDGPFQISPPFKQGLNGVVITPLSGEVEEKAGPSVSITGQIKASDEKSQEIFCIALDVQPGDE